MNDKSTLKDTTELTSIVINHLNMAVFLIDENYHLTSLNDSLSDREKLFINPNDNSICSVIVESINCAEDDQGCENRKCVECELMEAIDAALKENRATLDKHLIRRAADPLRGRYYRYSCKPLLIDGKKNALLMIDDITDIEKQRAELFEQNKVIHQFNDKFKKDLVLAKHVQNSIIPKEPLVCNGYHVDFIYFPLEDIGGDMFDIIEIDDERIGIFMCDVVGHGLPAALVTTMVKALLATYSNILTEPEKLMNRLNRQLIEMVGEPYMTAFYGVLDTVENRFNFVRAGHPFPWRLNDAIQTFGQQSNPMIGIDEDVLYLDEAIDLRPGDKIILYTDGLLDVGTDDGNYESRLIDLFDSNLHITGKQLLGVLKDDLVSNVSNEKHMDDVCVLVVENTLEPV